MTLTPAAEDLSEEELATAQNCYRLWQEGTQPEAINQVRPYVDQGKRWAISMLAWMLMQRDSAEESSEAITVARRAVGQGMPWSAVMVFNHVIGRIGQYPDLLDPLIDLAALGAPWPAGIDLFSQGWNLVGQGRIREGVRLMGATVTYPLSDEQWVSYVKTARDKTSELEGLLRSAHGERDRVASAAEESLGAIEQSRQDLETSAKQAGLLVSTVGTDAINALFKEDAERNKGESSVAWGWGLVVLVSAALMSFLPLLLHYLDKGPDYSATAVFGVHLAATVTLATLAGVLLARARARDLARQRANDLATAIGTMVAYSNQITDTAEKERFTTTMGQLILQAHLTYGSSGHSKEESLSGLVALANLMRVSSGAPASNQTQP